MRIEAIIRTDLRSDEPRPLEFCLTTDCARGIPMPPERGTALVTGAGRGIGFAIAEGLWRAGFKVAMASLETTPTPQSREMLQDARCRYYSFDLADISQHQGLLDRLEGELGPISCLVNNAGITSLVRGDM